MTNWTQAANGLTYRVFKLQHVQLPNRFARGKYYDLDDVGDEDSQAMGALLLRHPQVCDRLGISHRFPVSLQLEYTPDKKHYWVVDSWPRGKALTELVHKGKGLPVESASAVMCNLAETLTELHENNIVLRDLRPSCIYVTENDDIHLTDFELAKLLDGSPTVRRGEVLPAPFRAPEVGGPSVNQSADYYSWAQIFHFVTTSNYPPTPARSELVDSLGLPKATERFVGDCLNLDPELRPNTFAKVIKQLTK